MMPMGPLKEAKCINQSQQLSKSHEKMWVPSRGNAQSPEEINTIGTIQISTACTHLALILLNIFKHTNQQCKSKHIQDANM